MNKAQDKTILILNGDMNRGGGTEKMTQVLSNILCEKYCVHVVSMQSCTIPYYKPCEQVAFHSLAVPPGKYRMLKSFCLLYKLVKILKVDVIINVDVFLSIYSIPLKFFSNDVRVISWEQFSIENDMGLSWANTLRSFALKYSDYYVCLTEGDLQAFKSRFRFKTPIMFIHNPNTEDSHNVKYCCSSKKIVTVGNFYYSKGLDLAIEVAQKVLTMNPGWVWYIYGDGPEMNKIRKQVEDANLSNSVILAGRISDKSKMYCDSAIYVLTSRTEGFGLVLLEAQGYHLPIVAFDVPYGPRSIISSGKNGYLIKPFNTNDMADAILRLINSNELRQSFSDHAQDDFEKFSLSIFSDKWISIINSF